MRTQLHRFHEFSYRLAHRFSHSENVVVPLIWYIPNGIEPRPSDPDQLMAAIHRAFDAGADGLLASREYNEMRMSSLKAFGDAIRQR